MNISLYKKDCTLIQLAHNTCEGFRYKSAMDCPCQTNMKLSEAGPEYALFVEWQSRDS